MAAIKSFRDRKTFIRFPPIRSQPLPLSLPRHPIAASLCYSFLSTSPSMVVAGYHTGGESLLWWISVISQLSFTRISHLPLEIENRSLLLTHDFHLATLYCSLRMKIASKISSFPSAEFLRARPAYFNLFRRRRRRRARAYTITVSRVINHET